MSTATILGASSVLGLACEATILPVRVFVAAADSDSYDAPASDEANVAQLARGIRAAAQQQADVINVSRAPRRRTPR